MPIDPEELERRAKAARAAVAKPRFIPRKERERLAAEKAAKEEAEKKRKLEDQERAHRESKKQWLEEAEKDERRKRDLERRGANDHKSRNGGRDRDTQREEPGDWKDVREARNGNASTSNGRKRTAQDIENENLLTRYLGPEVNKHSKFSAAKKRQRTAANKFNFDWDPSEDTTRDDDYGTAVKPKIPKPSGSAVSVGNRFDEAAEQRALIKASAIRERDRETGEERAKGIMDDFYRSREKEEQRLQKSSMGRKWATKSLADMTERDWRIFKEDFAISTKGGSLPNPMRSWQESGLSRTLLEIVDKVGYSEPSAIQRAAIPIALGARDVIGVAHTGSGKTAAFILPMLDYISTLPLLTEVNRDDGPYALILAPTRELAQQIESEALRFAQPLGFNCVSIVGGHSLEEQSHAMRNGAEIVVATPGRLVDCLERRLLVLSQCCYLVMDEADRMIDLGFEESVNKILDALPVSNEKPDTDDAENAQLMKSFSAGMNRYRQTMMYTATMPPSLEKIAKKYLRRPAIVTIGNVGEAVDTVEQRVEFAGGEDRRKKRLQEILSSGEFSPPMIVFVNIKRNCDAIAHEVRRMGWSTVALHGSKTQEQREAALQSVRDGHTQVLVATDLAGRGIDVADISLVVNFNMATSIENYTHRIGRTGRAGKSGVAITFLDGTEDPGILYDLKQMLSKSSLSKVPEELKKRAAAQPKFPKAGR